MKLLNRKAVFPKKSKPCRYKPSPSKGETLRHKRATDRAFNIADHQISFWDNMLTWHDSYLEIQKEILTPELQ